MKRAGKKIIAFTLCTLMIFTTLFSGVSFSYAEEENLNAVEEMDISAANLSTQASVVAAQATAAGEPAPEQFSDIVTSATVSKITDIKMTDSLRIELTFKLPEDVVGGWLLEEHYIYEYDINAIEAVNQSDNTAAAALIAQTSTSEPLPVIMDGVNVGTYTIVNGKVTINFKNGLEYLKRSDISRVGTFEFQCGLEEDAFADNGGTYTLKFSSASTVVNPTITTAAKDVIKAGVKVEKSNAVFDADTKTARYTITVDNVSGDDIHNLVINDEMGTYLTYAGIETGGIIVDYADPQNVKFTIATVPAGVTTFTYLCSVDDAAFMNANSQGGNSSGLNNSITAKVNDKDIYIDNSSTKKQDTGFDIKKDIVAKSSAVEKDANGKEFIRWTIYINRGATEFDLNGYAFSDALQTRLTFVPNSASVSGDNQNIKDGLKDVIQNGGSYTFPEGSTGEYVISYLTTVPEHEGLASYTNTATISDGTPKHTDTATATSPEIGSALANKQAGTPYVDDVEGSVTEGELIIPWTTTITIPQGTVTELVYKDFMYGWYGENGKGFVTEAGGIFTITLDGNVSLAKDTDYTVTGSDLDRTITFTQDGLSKVGGKTITIAYKTIGNYKDRTYNDGNNTYTNRYNLTYNSITETGSASVIKPKEEPVSPDSFIDKSVSDYDEDKHTITWKITVKAGETCNIKNLILEDTIEGMEYWGYNGTECSAADAYVYIQDSSWMKFKYPMKVEDISSGGTPKYKFTIDFTDDTLSLTDMEAWGDPSTWLNKDSLDKEFNIYYTTKVCGDKLLYNNTTTYSNSVDATATINDAPSPTTDHSSASKEIETKVLTKECIQNVTDGANVLTYVINVNPDGLKLNPSATQGFYTVEDTMPSNQIWINDAAKTVLKNSKTGEILTRVNSADTVKAAGAGNNIYHVSYINNVLTFTVPDEVPITIEYKVTMLSDSNQGNLSYVNTVLLAEPYVGNQSLVENRENRRVASSSMTMVGSRLFETSKVDALDTTKYLSGATFEAVEYSWDEATQVWKASGNTYTVTTDSTGRTWDSGYTREGSSTGTVAPISKNKYYVIKEKTAPYGYELSDQVYKVIVVDVNAISSDALSKLPSDVYRITAGTELIFSDMPSQHLPENELVINKKYYKADGVTEADTMPATNAALVVYEGDLTLADCESGMYTPLPTGTIEGNFTYENINNKLTLKEIPDGDYTVYEKTAPNGYDRLNTVYHFKVTDHKISWEGETAEYKPSEKTIKNKQTFDNSITINKRYFKAADVSKSSPLTVIPDNAVFTCTKTHEPDGNGGYIAVNGTAELMTTTDGFTYTLSKLSAGKYEIKENVSDIYNTDSALPLTVEVSAIGTITITDNSGNPVQLVSGETLNHREITVDNVIKDNSFSINKTYYDANGALIEALNIPETVAGAGQQKVIFNLLKWNGTGDKSVKSSYMATVINSDYADYDLEKATAAGQADKYVWKNIEPGYYMAEEVLKPGDNTDYEALTTVFFYVDSSYKIHVNNEATGSYDGTADVKNRKVNGDICRFYLEKRLANQSGTVETLVDGQPADISFKLTRDSDNTLVPFTYNATTARWEATGLQEGSYTVQETGRRVGYKAAESIKFTIQQKQSGNGLEISQIRYGNNTPNTNTADFRTSTVVEDGMETMVATLVNRPLDNKLTLTKQYVQPNGSSPAIHATSAEFTVYRVENTNLNVVGNMEIATTPIETHTISNLDPGNYIIKETAPAGFKNLTNPIKFTVSDNYHITVETSAANEYRILSGNASYGVMVGVDNILTNEIVITKQFTDVNGNLVDVSTMSALRTETNFKLFDALGAEVLNKLIYDSSAGTITVSDLNAGTYYIQETTTPEGYVPALDIKLSVASDGKITAEYLGTRSDFTSAYGNGTTNVSATLYNRKEENQLVIQKKYYMADGVTEIPISQINQFASFELTMNGSPCNAEVTVSPRTGKYTFKNLLPGTYVITETAPAGYTAVSSMEFRVESNGKIKLPDTSSTPQLSGWKDETSPSYSASIKAINYRVPNKLQLKKYYYDASGVEITNPPNIAQFKLKDISGNEYPLNYDNTTGLYSVVNVPSGTYSLIEDAPAGYKQSGVIAVVVAEAGTISASYSGTTASDFAITGSGTTESAFIVYKNHQVTNSITINKSYVSATGKKLDISSDLTDAEYAEFKLYKDYGKSYQTEITGAKIAVNKEMGTYTFMNLDEGDYTIVENAGVSFETYRDITFSVYADKTIHNLSENELGQSDDYNKEIKVENVRKSYTNSFKLNKSFVDAEGNVVTDSAVYENLINNTSFVIADAYGNETPVTYDTNIRAFVVENLEPGYYLIKEKTSPNNYIPAANIGLQVVKASPVRTIIYVRYNGMLSDMDITGDTTATPSAVLRNYSVKNIYISKRTLSGADELAGAVLSITDVTDNTVIEEWISGTVEHRITVNKFVKNRVYKLQETAAPFGYERIEQVYFMINNNDEVLVSDSENGTYTVALDNLIIVRDADKKINISKVDYDDASMVSGAILIIKDASQNTVVSEWISGDTPYELAMSLFEAGQIYTLTELSAPNGYDVAAPVKFKFDIDGNIFIYNDTTDAYEMISGNGIVMKDKKSDVSSVTENTTEATTETATGSNVTTKGPTTGDKTPLAVIFTIFVISMAGVVVLAKKRKNI